MHRSFRLWADVGVALAIVLMSASGAALAGLHVWFQLSYGGPDRADYQSATYDLAGAALGVLTLTPLVVLTLKRARWLLGWALVWAVALGLAAHRCASSAAAAPVGRFPGSVARSEVLVPLAWMPGWPLDLLALVAVVLLGRRLARRAATAR